MIMKKESLVEGSGEGGMMALDCKFMAVYGTCIIIILPTSIFSFVGSDRCLPVRIVIFCRIGIYSEPLDDGRRMMYKLYHNTRPAMITTTIMANFNLIIQRIRVEVPSR